MKVIILCAGKGSRLKHSTPKPLQKLSGLAMIDHIINACVDSRISQISDITAVLGHHADLIKAHLDANHPELNIFMQDMSKSGSAAALFGYEFSLDEDYLILNADMPLISKELLNRLSSSSAALALSVFSQTQPNSYGRVICQDDKFVKIVEAKDASAAELACTLCNGGLYKIKGEILHNLLGKITNQNASGEYYLTDICALALEAGAKIECVQASPSELMGVNDLADLARAQAVMNERICDYWRRAGHIIANGAQIDARAQLINECEIASGVVIKGACVLDNCVILENSVLERSKIARSQLGPMARVRPDCEINECKIGNFVECKAAILDGVKAGHLAYLGDCSIQAGTNIGCGVIVCNYDGVSKHHTHIGKNCFIGSNVNLIAPINVPDGAFIAAGSTLNAKGAKMISQADLGAIYLSRAPGVVIRPKNKSC